MEEKTCQICGKKMKDNAEVCKKCKADPTERIIVDCRGISYANTWRISAYVNMILTDRRLLAFEDIKGALSAGVVAGVAGGIGSGLGMGSGMGVGIAAGEALQKAMGGEATRRPVAKGINGSLKYEAPIASITGISTVEAKEGEHILINGPGKKPLRVVFGTSFDNAITGDMFLYTLMSAIGR